jgi:transglutaminase-like putative cysteine protease
MVRRVLVLALLFASPALALAGDAITYRIRQTVTLSAIDEKAKTVEWWVSIPDDHRDQEVLDLSVVSAPGPWRVVREAERGNRFLYVEANSPGKSSLDVVVEFTVRRRPVAAGIDPSKVGAIDDSNRAIFAEELRLDAPNMEVSPEVAKMAAEACGSEKNLAKQAELLLARVAEVADHYSKDPSKPSCGIGSAKACLAQGGGCCTDLHSLFIAMARSRGIPARLQMGYRVQEKNEGKEVDPGYRCWVEYFLPNYGWVPADIVEADAPGGLGKAVWFTGLTERRIWLNEGRDFVLPPNDSKTRVNHMSIAYAEIDGVPARLLPEGDLKPQITRKILCETVVAKTADASDAVGARAAEGGR